MSWERFHASCRRHLQAPERAFDDTLDYFRSTRDSDLLGWPASRGSLPDQLMQGLSGMDAEARIVALKTYARMDLDVLVRPPTGVLRTSAYLLLLSLVLVAMVSTFNLFVMPSLQAFSQMNAGVMPESSLQIARWMPLLLIGVVVLAVYALASSLALRGVLAAVDTGLGTSRFEWLLPAPVRRHRGRLLELIASPVSGLRAGPLQNELEALAANGLRIEEELPALLRLQAQRLLLAAHRFNFGLLSVLAATVFACIATLLVALYLPIFKMGSML